VPGRVPASAPVAGSPCGVQPAAIGAASTSESQGGQH
jgi:hypothetical protein